MNAWFVQELGLIPVPATAAATARFLKGTVMLDRSMLGEYLSRGPVDKYPFHAQVTEECLRQHENDARVTGDREFRVLAPCKGLPTLSTYRHTPGC